ncbi:MAG: ATPase [Pyrobaculum sp.]
MNAKAVLIAVLASVFVFAQASEMKYIGAGIAVGLAGLGAGIGVGIAGAAAMSAMVERPEERVWYLIFLALAEAIAIYGLLIGILLVL